MNFSRLWVGGLLFACQNRTSGNDVQSDLGVRDSSSVTDAGSDASADANLDKSSGYLLTVHACDTARTDCNDPVNHETWLLDSDDGKKFSVLPNFAPFAGSVPDVVRRDNTLYVYTPGELHRIDETTGKTTETRVTIDGTIAFVDPCPLLDNGKIVLFFLHCVTDTGEAAMCFGHKAGSRRLIGSATEVNGSDGAEFVLDDDARIELWSSAYPNGTDPDVFFDGAVYVLYVSVGSSFSLWTSDELRGTYSLSPNLPNGILSDNQGGVPSGHFDSATASYWSFAHYMQDGATLVRRAVHASLETPLASSDWSELVRAKDLGLAETARVESPGFAVNTP